MKGLARVIVILGPALLATVAPVAPAADPGGDARGPLAGWSVLLVTLDTLRADRVGCYGYGLGSTPVLDRLALEGIRFEEAVVQVPLTVPSHASILTGTYPIFHGARNNANYPLPGDRVTLAERFREAGYATEAVLASRVLYHGFGLDQGFDHYDDDIRSEEGAPGKRYRLGEHVTRRALARIGALPDDRPFFLWSHYYDPHAPYRAPEPFASRFPDAPYDAEVAYTDACVGRLLQGIAAMGRADRLLTVVISDHGEGLGDPHDELTHGIFLYEETLRVPFLIHAPEALPAGRVVRELVRSIDLAPTVLELAGLEVHADVQGTSLVPAIVEGAPVAPLESYSDTIMPREAYGWSAMFGLRDAEWKYIRAPRPELYHLPSDPKELRNLASEEEERRRTMEAALRRIEETLGREDAGRPQRGDLPADVQQQLEVLGYVGASTPAPAVDSNKDPKDYIAVQNDLNDAITLRDLGRTTAALEKLDSALRLDPQNIEVRRQKGEILLEEGALREAAQLFSELASDHPDDVFAHFRLGQAHRELSKRAAAAGDDRAEQSHRDRAADAYGHVLALNPRHALSLLDLANILVREGKTEEAISLYRRAYESNPALIEPRINRARVLDSLGRSGEARHEIEWVAEHEPEAFREFGLEPYLAELSSRGAGPSNGLRWALVGIGAGLFGGAGIVLLRRRQRKR